MIISVDHGNKSIKTPNALFTSGLIVSEGLQGFKTDYICWNNKYYTLTEQRIAYLRDKTEDERFYVLTLFAIAKELERRKVPETLDPIDITLLVGLPMSSCTAVSSSTSCADARSWILSITESTTRSGSARYSAIPRHLRLPLPSSAR